MIVIAETFRYDAGNGSMYARYYALYDRVPPDQQLFYYDPEDDCTNFISQCVWAAYGGWLPGFSGDIVARNSQRIRKNIRQVPAVWFGSKWNIGATRWCRVEEFYHFITAAKRLGPRARQITEGKFIGVDPSVVRPGDVIQMVVTSYTPDRFGHSLYVTQGGSRWEDILICCHSFDRQNAPMTLFTQFPDTYARLRLLRFDDATFDS